MMNPMMNMNMMPQMMQHMMSSMPGMNMMPQMMNMPGMNMMPMMMPVMPMMVGMTCEMTSTGMTCKMTPMNGMTMEMMKESCERMMSTMKMGMPVMMMCGNMMCMCMMPEAKMEKAAK